MRTLHAWAVGIAMVVVACADTPGTESTAIDPANIAASTESQEQLGVARWDVRDAPSSVAGYDADGGLVLLLRYERIEEGGRTLHRFGLREHANQATTQWARPEGAPPEEALQLLARQVSDGFDPIGVAARMARDFGPSAGSSALSTTALGSSFTLRPLDQGQCGQEDILVCDEQRKLIEENEEAGAKLKHQASVLARGSTDCLGASKCDDGSLKPE